MNRLAEEWVLACKQLGVRHEIDQFLTGIRRHGGRSMFFCPLKSVLSAFSAV